MKSMVRIVHGRFGRALLGQLNHSIVPHVHHQAHALFKLGGGRVLCEIGDSRLELEHSSAVMIDGWTSHSLRLMDSRKPATLLALYIEPGWMASLMQQAESDVPWGYLTGNRKAIDRSIEYLRDIIVAAIQTEDPFIEAPLFELAVQLLRNNARPVPFAWRSRAEKRIVKALQIMSENQERPKSMAAIANQIGMSRARFFAHFKSNLGISPGQYENYIRVERTLEEFGHNNQSLLDMALDLGFGEQSSFTRFFRKNIGVSPAAYRAGLTLGHH